MGSNPGFNCRFLFSSPTDRDACMIQGDTSCIHPYGPSSMWLKTRHLDGPASVQLGLSVA